MSDDQHEISDILKFPLESLDTKDAGRACGPVASGFKRRGSSDPRAAKGNRKTGANLAIELLRYLILYIIQGHVNETGLSGFDPSLC